MVDYTQLSPYSRFVDPLSSLAYHAITPPPPPSGHPLIVDYYTIVSQASAHSRGKHPCSSFQGSSFYTNIWIMSRVSAHADQNCDVCLSAHGRLSGTLRYFSCLTYIKDVSSSLPSPLSSSR